VSGESRWFFVYAHSVHKRTYEFFLRSFTILSKRNYKHMTNNNYQNTEEEIQELDRRLKVLKKQSQEGRGGRYILPASILIAALLISGAFVYSKGKSVSSQQASLGNAVPQQAPPPSFGGGSSDNVKPVSSEDHILGSPDAPVKIVEFSDLECPFCKRFHPTLQQVMDEYGESGQVAWVYRHFPLDQIHSKARKEAEATECANELGGNDSFWSYLDKLYEITPSNNGLDLSLLPQIAEDVGLNRSQFESCLNSGKYAQHIEDDYQDSTASGGTGTPYSVVIAPNGNTFAVSGAQPYSAVKSIIELALKEK